MAGIESRCFANLATKLSKCFANLDAAKRECLEISCLVHSPRNPWKLAVHISLVRGRGDTIKCLLLALHAPQALQLVYRAAVVVARAYNLEAMNN